MLISPSGNTTATPTYSWNAVSGAEFYQLWINDSATNGKIQQWYMAAEVGCASGTGTCSITPATPLASGAATWWVQAWNNCNGGSYGPWSDGMVFTVTIGGSPGPMFAYDTKQSRPSPYTDPSDSMRRWEFQTADLVSSSPAIARDGKVYVRSQDGKVNALNRETKANRGRDWAW
jgi:outer membrane protein assembly factor BamB